MASKIAVGDRVQYSKSFLQSTGQLTGDVPHAKGTVSDIKAIGKKSLVTVDWGNENVPPRVLADNLSKLK